jgi:cation diffusion facilitator family transporter
MKEEVPGAPASENRASPIALRLTGKRLAYLEGWIAVVLNIGLFAVKYWAGTTHGSVSMVADAWHTLSDSLTSLVVIIGFYIASRPADHGHPFGHGRAEPIGAVIIGTLLGVVAVVFLVESVDRLRHFTAASFGTAAIVVFGASAVLKEAMAQFAYWAGRKLDSTSLVADAWHHRSDAIASAFIVGGALLGTRLWWIDGVMGILISLLILYAMFDTFRAASASLLGQKPTPEMEGRLAALIAKAAPLATHFHHLHVHSYGEHRELTFHLKLPPLLSLHDAHALATGLERAIREQMSAEATIHLEPAEEPRQ